MCFNRAILILVTSLLIVTSCGQTGGLAGGPIVTLKFGYSANTGSNTISVFKVSPSAPVPRKVDLVGGVISPRGLTYFQSSGAGPFLYVANSVNSGTISSFAVNSLTGDLTKVQDVSTGSFPYALAVSGTTLYSADSGSGQVSSFRINPSTGGMTSITTYVTGGAPLAMSVDATGRFLFVAVSGSKSLISFSIASGTGALTQVNAQSTGNLPSGVAVDPVNSYIYVSNNGDGTVSTYSYNAAGTLSSLGNHTVGSGPVGLAVDLTGRFLYVGNSIDKTLSVCSINSANGALTDLSTVPVLDGPTAVSIDPLGGIVYTLFAGSSNSLGIYGIDITSGGVTLDGYQGAGTSPEGFVMIPVVQSR